MRRFSPVLYLVLFVLFFSCATSNAQVEFTSHVIDSDFPTAFCSIAEDFDRDGDIDVVGTSFTDQTIAWWENDGEMGFTRHMIYNESPCPYEVFIVDLDLDEDLDLVCPIPGFDMIYWMENDGAMSFTQHTVTDSIDEPFGVYALDFDDDGDIDIISAVFNSNAVYWHENDGAQNFTDHLVSDQVMWANSVFAADLDNDADMDIIASGRLSETLWWENDGSFNFTERAVFPGSDHSNDVTAADMDGDGDLDILMSGADWDYIQCWENNNNEYIRHDLCSDYHESSEIVARDLDRDGDLDVVAVSRPSTNFYWWENQGNLEFAQHTIFAEDEWSYRTYVSVADFDGDGDNDLVTNREIDAGDNILWWESNLMEYIPPSPAQLVSPVYGSQVNSLEVELVWNTSAVNDSAGESNLTYQAEYSIWEDFSFSFQADAGEDTSIVIGDLQENRTYYWRVITSDDLGNTVLSEETWCFHVELIDNVDNPLSALPATFSVSAYPNPFNSELSINVSLPVTQDLSVSISDLLGRELEAWNTGILNAGTHKFNWTADDYPAGIYFVRIVAQDYNTVNKVLLLK